MENKIDMKRKIFGIIVVMVLLLFVACDKKEKLDLNDDHALIEAMMSARNQSDKGIDIEALENSIIMYEKRGEKGKVCLCDALIGYKLFFATDYDKSLIHLKRAEANIQYCDSIASFIYAYIVNNTKATDSILALNYAQKALNKDLEYNNLKRLPYSYLNLSLLSKGDSAQYYLQKSLDLFDEDKKIMAKAQFGRYHAQEMNADSVIKYVKPYYEKINYVGYAHTLVEAYIRKDMPDSTKQYIQHLASRKDCANVYFYCNAKIMTLNKEYEEACKLWEMAYESNEEELKFMISQRLSAINAEYDLLNEELENRKEKLRMRGIYNVLLIVVIVVLVVTYIIKESYRKSAHKLKINVNELEQEVGGLEQNVDDLKQEVSCLEQEVSGLELEVSKQKGRYAVLFNMYKQGYNVDRKTMVVDAQKNLNKLHEEYTDLTKTDLTIIWLTFMDCSRDMICDLMNITQKYYYQRKSLIQQILGIPIRNEEGWNKTLESIVMRYINELKIRS